MHYIYGIFTDSNSSSKHISVNNEGTRMWKEAAVV